MTRTLSARAILVTCATAVVSVIVTALVALPVAVRAANSQAKVGLGEKANLVGEVLANSRRAEKEALLARLRQQKIKVYLVQRGVADQPGLPGWAVSQVAAGF